MLKYLAFLGNSPSSSQGTLHLTFHDAPPPAGSNVVKVNMNVIETQIIDFYDNKITVSTEPMSFDLLQLTKNNPVALAHAAVPAGTYKGIGNNQ